MQTLLAAVALAVAWAAMTGAVTVVNLVFGFVLGAAVLIFVRNPRRTGGRLRRGHAAVELGLVFLWELLKSSVGVARIVLSPRRELSPAILPYPLAVTGDVEITLLANMITLTPGTLSIDVSHDRTTLFVHVIDAPDPAAVIEAIRRSFEVRIARLFR